MIRTSDYEYNSEDQSANVKIGKDTFGKDSPYISADKWRGGCVFAISHPDIQKNGTRKLRQGRLEIKIDNKTHRFFTIPDA